MALWQGGQHVSRSHCLDRSLERARLIVAQMVLRPQRLVVPKSPPGRPPLLSGQTTLPGLVAHQPSLFLPLCPPPPLPPTDVTATRAPKTTTSNRECPATCQAAPSSGIRHAHLDTNGLWRPAETQTQARPRTPATVSPVTPTVRPCHMAAAPSVPISVAPRFALGPPPPSPAYPCANGSLCNDYVPHFFTSQEPMHFCTTPLHGPNCLLVVASEGCFEGMIHPAPPSIGFVLRRPT